MCWTKWFFKRWGGAMASTCWRSTAICVTDGADPPAPSSSARPPPRPSHPILFAVLPAILLDEEWFLATALRPGQKNCGRPKTQSTPRVQQMIENDSNEFSQHSIGFAKEIMSATNNNCGYGGTVKSCYRNEPLNLNRKKIWRHNARHIYLL